MFNVRRKLSRTHLTPAALALLVLVGFWLAVPAPATETSGASKTLETPEVSGDGRIPDNLIALDPGERGTAYTLVVEKATQTLYLYAYDGDRFRLVMDTDCATGKSDGPKRVSGDAKTPEGIYFFIDEHEDRELSPIYGIKAFPTDYPNLLDRLSGLTGSAIWLHGTNTALQPRSSNGCVVVENEVLARLADRITLHRTPLVVVERISTTTTALREIAREAVLEFLDKWRESLTTGTYHQYLAAYSPSYLPAIDWWRRWSVERSGSSIEGGIAVRMDDLAVLKHGDTYVARFDLYLDGNGTRVYVGTRKLFLSYDDDVFSVIGDEYPRTPPSDYRGLEARAHKPSLDKAPLLAALDALTSGETETVAETAAAAELPAPVAEAEIASLVDRWLAAWTSKNIEAYGEFYGEDFRSQGKDREAWLRHKAQLNRQYDYIRVTRDEDLTVDAGDPDRPVVSFTQHYDSSGYSATGQKRLVLTRQGAEWKIIRETWQRR